MLCHGCGRKRSAYTENGRLIGCGYNDHSALQPFFAEDLEELAHFAPPLADQRQHGHIRGSSARHHSDECAFSNPASAKDSYALPSAARQETIDRSNSAAERFANWHAFKGQRRRAVDSDRMDGPIIAFSIQRIAGRIDDATQHLRSNPDRWTRAPGNELVPEANSLRLIGGHRQHCRTAKPDDLTRIILSAVIHNQAGLTHRAEWSFRLNQVTDNLADSAVPSKR
jgi:hypothetical protein